MTKWIAAVTALASLAVSEAQEIELQPVAEGFDRPVAIAHAGDGTNRLFVAEQSGRIWALAGGEMLPGPFLDVSSLVSCCNERGLLGLAFHPDYELNGWLYVNYTDVDGTTRIVRYTVSDDDANRAEPGSAVLLISIPQPFANHNGGQLAFGPDANLWIATGDGGSAGDPFGNAQNTESLLGKILRLDVNVEGASPYAIPEDNPFRFDPSARGEIWALGLRNPWRFSFDRLTGDLFIADVGQNAVEEVNFEPATSPGGVNYGWRRMEGTRCFDPGTNCNDGTLALPILEYTHEEGCSITGGYRYRGGAPGALYGTYVFGDFCSGTIWGGTVDENGAWSRRVLLETDLRLASFGEDELGELYIAELAGSVFRILPQPPRPVPGETVGGRRKLP